MLKNEITPEEKEKAFTACDGYTIVEILQYAKLQGVTLYLCSLNFTFTSQKNNGILINQIWQMADYEHIYNIANYLIKGILLYKLKLKPGVRIDLYTIYQRTNKDVFLGKNGNQERIDYIVNAALDHFEEV